MSAPPETPGAARDILRALLDRAEQPGRKQVARVRLSPEDHPGYFSADDVAPRRDTNLALQALERAGVVALRWKKWEEGSWLEWVDAVPGRAADLAAALGRRPRADRADDLLRLLAAQAPRPGWHAEFLGWAAEQVAAGRSPAPLDLDDRRSSADLLRLLGAVADGGPPALERTLSARLFGDSKRLEALRGGLARVLRQHAPGARAFGDDDAALLRAYGLERVPEYVPVAGPLALRIATGDGGPPALLDIGAFLPSVALSAAMLRAAEAAVCGACAAVTVENATSFSELLAARPPDVLAIYTGGFASPSVVGLLRSVRALRPTLPLAHWGDLDAGGLRILAHLRAQLGEVAALAMDEPTLAAHRDQVRPLTAGDRAALLALAEHPALADRRGLVARMLESGAKLEQEAVPSGAALAQLPGR